MSLSVEEKNKIIETYQSKAGDTGSPEVQIALLSARISYLTTHFKTHTHDHHSRRGLRRMINQRRKLLNYLKQVDVTRYREVIDRLNLRS